MFYVHVREQTPAQGGAQESLTLSSSPTTPYYGEGWARFLPLALMPCSSPSN